MFIDIAFILVLIIAIFRGLSKGLILGVFSFITILIGLAAALKLSVVVANYLKNSVVGVTKWLPVISFILVLVVVILLVNLVARLIKKTIDFAMLGWVDSIGGMVFYIGLYSILFSIFLFYGVRLKLISPDMIAGSRLYTYIAPWGPFLIENLGKVIPLFKNMFTDLENFFASIAKKAA
jgi:membrane protein required for colicin V production